MKPKVLLLMGSLIPEYMAVWRSVADHGVDLHIAGTLALPFRDPRYQPRVPGFAQTHLFAPRGWRRRGHLWWSYPGLGGLIEGEGFDVVHVLSEPWGLLVSQAVATTGRVVAHGAENRYRQGDWLEDRLRLFSAGRNLKRLHGFVSWNTTGTAEALRAGLPSSIPMLVVPSTVPDPALFTNGLGRENRENDAFRVGFVGRLHPQKGVDWLISAFAAAALPNAVLRIAGSGEARPELEGLARQLGVPAIFEGALPVGEVPRFLKTIDLLVVPSRSFPGWAEQFGRVVVEAMLAGTPVIASTCGDLPEVLGDAGVLVEEDDADGLARTLTSLARSPVTRAEMALRGMERVRAVYAPEVIAAKLISYWKDAIAGDRLPSAT